MRFGVCAGIQSAQVLFQYGFDYIELAVASDLDPDSADWYPIRREIESMPLPVEAFNSFIRTGKLVGPCVNIEWLRCYVNTALTRAAQVGGSIIVFGSGGVREYRRVASPKKLIDSLSSS